MEHSPIARRTSLLQLCATMLFVAILNVACGGDDSPSTTVSPEPVPTTPAPAAEPDAPEFADAVAGQLASLTLQALRQAVGVPPVGFTTSDNPSRLSTGTFRVSCPAGGSMEMTQLPTSLPFIGQVGLSEVKEVYTSCSYTEGGTTYTTNGNVTVNGSYFIAENVPQQLEVSDDLSTTPGEDCPVAGRVTADRRPRLCRHHLCLADFDAGTNSTGALVAGRAPQRSLARARDLHQLGFRLQRHRGRQLRSLRLGGKHRGELFLHDQVLERFEPGL